MSFRVAEGAIRTILETDPESLVARVAAAEMPGVAHLEALKALAVVVRTFIVANRGRHRDGGFNFAIQPTVCGTKVKID